MVSVLLSGHGREPSQFRLMLRNTDVVARYRLEGESHNVLRLVPGTTPGKNAAFWYI